MSNEIFNNVLISCPNEGGLFVIHDNQPTRLDSLATTGLHWSSDVLLRAEQPSSLWIYKNKNVGVVVESAKEQDIHDVLVVGEYCYLVGSAKNEIIQFNLDGIELKKWTFPGEDDSQHINCIGTWNGKVVFSAFGDFHHTRGYKGKTAAAGFVQDLISGERLITGLSQPHSPVEIGGNLLIANSEEMELREYSTSGRLIRSKKMDGYTRGLCAVRNAIYIGLSCSRNINSYSIDSATLVALDQKTWEELGRVRLPAKEIYSVAFIDEASQLLDVVTALANKSSSKYSTLIAQHNDLITNLYQTVGARDKELESVYQTLGKRDEELAIAYGDVEERERNISTLHAIVSEHEQQTIRLSENHAEREQAHLKKFNQAQRQIEAQFEEAIEREKRFSLQLQELQKWHEQQKNDLRDKHAQREQVHAADMNRAQQEIEAQLKEAVEREKRFSLQLQEIQKWHEQQKKEISHQHAERRQAHGAEINKAQQKIETQLKEAVEREKRSALQQQEIRIWYEQQIKEISQQQEEREQAHVAEINKAQQKIEAHLKDIVEREKTFSSELQEIQQRHELERKETSRQYAEREKAYLSDLEKGKTEIHEQVFHWQNVEKDLRKTINEFQSEITLVQATYSWRYTAPFRAFATILSRKNVDRYKHSQRFTDIPINDHGEKIPFALNEMAGTPPASNVNNMNKNMQQSSHANTIATLEELLSKSDENFIFCAYESLLGRGPDRDGLKYYLDRLRAGTSKLEILSQIHLSKEGKIRPVKVIGLSAAIKHHQHLRKPILGVLLRFFGVFRSVEETQRQLYSIERRLSAHNVQMEYRIEELRRTLEEFARKNEARVEVTDSDRYVALSQFDPSWYLRNYPDVAASGMNPYEHFILQGITEGRRGSASSEDHKNEEGVTNAITINKDLVTKVDKFSELQDLGSQSFKKVVKLICFYLPQYHPIAENNKWWGDGFTEWTNVRPAKSQFKGHYQPRIPHELGYYSLLDQSTQRRQVELAKAYGIEGFCFYFYWFGGKRLLETPVENYLRDQSLTLPFCLCWANENWSRRWDGLENEILISQQHSAEDDLAFIECVSQYMRDSRYIRINGRPLLLVYRPSLLPSPRETVERWRKWCRSNGVGEIYLAYTQSFEKSDPSEYGFDAAIEFPPNNSNIPNVTKDVEALNDDFECNVYDWTALVERSRDYSEVNYTLFRGVCPSWDNTARRKNKSSILVNSTPYRYQEWLCNSIADTTKRIADDDERMVFINAWNEWAEGAYLEPDERYGYAYLEATRMALLRSSIQQKMAVQSESKDQNERSPLAIVIHAFYIDILDEIVGYLSKVTCVPLHLYVTCPREVEEDVSQALKAQPHKFNLHPVDNRGRDVLPFLKIFPTIVEQNHELFVKVHTKKSTHRADGDRWRKELYEQLISDEAIKNTLYLFDENPRAGIIGPADHVVPMNYYFGSNAGRTQIIANRLGMGLEELMSLNFVAGTMFAARVSAILPLLSLGMADEDFELESGQIDGTLAHAIERAISASAWAVNTDVVTLSDIVIGNYAFAEKTVVT